MGRGIDAALSGLCLIVLGIGGPAAAQEAATSTSTPGTSSTADTLPPLPQSGFGVAAPTAPLPSATSVTAPSAPSLRLSTPGSSVAPLQQNDPEAPAFLIRPTVALSEGLTDNVRATASRRTADLETRFSPGLSISADTPRVQAVLNAGFDLYKYAFAADQDRELVNLYGNATAVALPDTLFIDLRSSVTQGSLTGALGFTPVAQQPKNQTTQVFTTSLSPYLRKSYDGLVDGELRYSFNTINSGGTGLTPTTATLGKTAALSDSTIHQGTLTLATGRDFTRLASRLTLDASKLDTTSVSRNTSLTAYDDLQYQILPNISAVARLGYEDIRYPGVPGATTVGAAWQVGGRLDFPGDTDYLIARYGKLQGIYGFSGSARYEITPATVLTAEASQGLASQQQQIAANLTSSQFDPTTGQILDQFNVPTAIVNPNFAVQNEVTHSKRFSVNLATTVEPNHFSVFGTYERRSSLTANTPPSTSIGINFDWGRDIRPNLTGHMGLGYTNTSNLSVTTLTAPTVITTINNTDTVSGNLSLSYTFNEALTGSVVYNVFYQVGGPNLASAGTVTVGNILTNRLTFALTKTF